MSYVTKATYGPVTVVRSDLSDFVYASAPGPQTLPVIVQAPREIGDGPMILRAVEACERAWGDVPRELRADLDRAVTLDPLDLVRESVEETEIGYSSGIAAPKKRRTKA